MQRVLVNVGCGHQRPQGWINTDCSLNAMLQRVPVVGSLASKALRSTRYEGAVSYLNLNRRWPFKDQSVDVLYGSHVFEHLSSSKARHFLREATRVLKPGGVIRLVVPDLLAAAKSYIAGVESKEGQATQDFLYVLNLHLENNYPPSKNIFYRGMHFVQDWPHQHKYMYDTSSLRALMGEHGIKDVMESAYGASCLIPEIKAVENTAEGIAAIYLEGTK